jgi:uncharacterized NAD(P)/FAD-binding protein YdhS
VTNYKTSYDVAIIGGGFSGTMLAVQLMRLSTGGQSIVVVNRDGRPGCGIAFGTEYDAHLLNTRVGGMSALPDQPDHFLKWIRRRVDHRMDSDRFVPRRLYGLYIEELFREHVKASPEVLISWIVDEVEGARIEGGCVCLKMRTGDEIRARLAVLATGNYGRSSPAALMGVSRRHYASDPWSKSEVSQIPSCGTILLLGSGLTAVDQVLGLEARNFTGTVVMLSKHGLLPSVHTAKALQDKTWEWGFPTAIPSLVSLIRRQIKIASAEGICWRQIIDSLRPESEQIWKSLPLREQKRFVRHVSPVWNVLRHRIPPESHVILRKLISSEKVKLFAGRLLDCKNHEHRVEIRFRERSTGKEVSLFVDFVINCTGSEGGKLLVENPFVKSIVDCGVAQPNPLGLGLDVDENGALIGPSGAPSRLLFAIGPLRKGRLWETTAVAEIRRQATRLATQISTRLHSEACLINRQG